MKFRTQIGIGTNLLRSMLTGARIPINVMISVTNQCTCRCSYCDIPLSKQPEMDTNTCFDLLDQLKQAGTQRIALWGGEPLLRADIGQIIEHAKKNGLYVTLDSNGYLVPDNLPIVKQLDYLLLSLDGPESVHDRNRQPGGFSKVMSALEAAIPHVPVMTLTVITKYNINSLDFIIDSAEKMGFVATFQLLYHNATESGNTDPFLPTNEEHRRIIKWLIMQKKNHKPIVASFAYLNHLLRWTDFRRKTLPYRSIYAPICMAGKLFCNIDVDGFVYPCNSLMREFPGARFQDIGFQEAFKRTAEHSCQSCIACANEFNLMSTVDISTVYNWFRYTTRRTGRKIF